MAEYSPLQTDFSALRAEGANTVISPLCWIGLFITMLCESDHPGPIGPSGGSPVRLFTSILLLLALVGCQSNGSSDTASTESTPDAASTQTSATGDSFTGVVIETMDAGGYTYVHVDTGEEKIWAAGPQQSMELDTIVIIGKSMPMPEFSSESLERTFDLLYFVTDFGTDKAQAQAAGSGDPHAGAVTPTAAANVDLGGIQAADHTVAAIYAEKDALAGKSVRVRGKVVKALSGIMGANWLHIQDGTGSAGTNDLTVTTSQMAEVGAMVVVEGVLGVDRDFGSGYKYAVIIEGAAVTVE